MRTVILLTLGCFFFTSIATESNQLIQKNIRNDTKWIYVEFFDCPSVLKINISAIREALARWINEECVTALRCDLDNMLTANNVFVGTIACGKANNFITFRVLKNDGNAFSRGDGMWIKFRDSTILIFSHSSFRYACCNDENVADQSTIYNLENYLDSSIVGKVIQSREHLLSALLHSDLKTVTVRIFKENEEQSSVNESTRLCSSAYCALIILLLFFFIAAFSVIYVMLRSTMKQKSIGLHDSLIALHTLHSSDVY